MSVKDRAAPIAYGAVELATLGRGVRRTINGETLRFPARWSRYYPSTYQERTHRFLRRHCRPGALAVDVGAHIGLFTVMMARAVRPGGAVVSFEPTPESRRALERTARLNGLEGTVEVREEAVARSSGKMTFYSRADPGCNANSLVPGSGGDGGRTVPTLSLDDFLPERPLPVCCIKLDAEGAEIEVLQGAARTIATHRPAVALDLHPAAIQRSGGTLEALWSLLRELRLAAAAGGRPVDRDWFCSIDETTDLELVPVV